MLFPNKSRQRCGCSSEHAPGATTGTTWISTPSSTSQVTYLRSLPTVLPFIWLLRRDLGGTHRAAGVLLTNYPRVTLLRALLFFLLILSFYITFSYSSRLFYLLCCQGLLILFPVSWAWLLLFLITDFWWFHFYLYFMLPVHIRCYRSVWPFLVLLDMFPHISSLSL